MDEKNKSNEKSRISSSLSRLFERIKGYSGSRRKEKSFEPVSEETIEARNNIIESIVTKGLVSGASLVSEMETGAFTSVDQADNEQVFGRTLLSPEQYRNEQHYIQSLAHLLYMTDNSVIPVLTERRGKSKEDNVLVKATVEEKNKISDRIWSSILVISKGSNQADELTRTSVPRDDIQCLLIPSNILEEYGDDKLARLGIPYKPVSAEIFRSLFHGDKISVPDYETAISEVLQETGESIWIHGVRLPTEADLHV